MDRVVVERESSVVRIVGRSREAVQAARRQLEMLSVSVPVPRDRFGYLVGKNGSNLEALKAKTGVATLQVRVCKTNNKYARYSDGPTFLRRIRQVRARKRRWDSWGRNCKGTKRWAEKMWRGVEWGAAAGRQEGRREDHGGGHRRGERAPAGDDAGKSALTQHIPRRVVLAGLPGGF